MGFSSWRRARGFLGDLNAHDVKVSSWWIGLYFWSRSDHFFGAFMPQKVICWGDALVNRRFCSFGSVVEVVDQPLFGEHYSIWTMKLFTVCMSDLLVQFNIFSNLFWQEPNPNGTVTLQSTVPLSKRAREEARQYNRSSLLLLGNVIRHLGDRRPRLDSLFSFPTSTVRRSQCKRWNEVHTTYSEMNATVVLKNVTDSVRKKRSKSSQTNTQEWVWSDSYL